MDRLTLTVDVGKTGLLHWGDEEELEEKKPDEASNGSRADSFFASISRLDASSTNQVQPHGLKDRSNGTRGMASPAVDNQVGLSINDDESDYGSDFSPEEEQIVSQLLYSQQVEIEDNPILTNVEQNIDQHDAQQTLIVPLVFGREQKSPLYQAARAAEEVAERINKAVGSRTCYADLTNEISRPIPQNEDVETVPADPQKPDTRSPLERFRTQPRKPLSVTDLVSPAWCELQYWYTLTKHGRKRRTPAMKEGSRVHKTLEDQVHTTVPVDVQSKEDAWGLRIWNVIQSLRTLRDTGLTRELEIWGTVDGLVVNGIIDELSFVCPDKDLEGSLEKPVKEKPPPDQSTISEFFKAAGQSTLETMRSKRRYQSDKIYLCDVKTRSVRTLPSEIAFRPTKMQLMLYHNLLSALATNNVDFSVLANRYKLDSSKVFSDSFIAQVGSLNDDEFYEASLEPPNSQKSITEWSQDSMTTLLNHNTLSLLWSLMTSEFQITLPDGAASLGKVLKAEYRSRNTGEIVGSKTFAMDNQELETYVEKEMQWWRGEREAQGVVVEEAFKCRSCDFAEDCEWRLKKVEDAKEKVRMTGRRTTVI